MDVVGGLLALLLASPLFALIALLVKATSRGPVLFRQTRVGQYGKRFTFLKFRSMYADRRPDHSREYVKKFIAGGEWLRPGCRERDAPTSWPPTRGSRPSAASCGKTSLDELPQFFNVLMGKCRWWARGRRFLTRWSVYRTLAQGAPAGGEARASPGCGRWRDEAGCKFDDMVRLDLQIRADPGRCGWISRSCCRPPARVFTANGAH